MILWKASERGARKRADRLPALLLIIVHGLTWTHSVYAASNAGLRGFANNLGVTLGIVAGSFGVALLLALKIYRATAIPKNLRDALHTKAAENEVRIEGEGPSEEQAQQGPSSRKALPQSAVKQHTLKTPPNSSPGAEVQPSFRSTGFGGKQPRSNKGMVSSNNAAWGKQVQHEQSFKSQSSRLAVKPKPKLHRGASSKSGLNKATVSPSSRQLDTRVSPQERKFDVKSGDARNMGDRLDDTVNPIHSPREVVPSWNGEDE
eukprot:gb/GECG01002792.1/.p1 GENE.gb/GECG01002792.1/~~gb/GECG01002792.1/.p1  ORF type:complete len:261 (+),score=30.06 gb/GECG01002792.1/:1-783(+)